MFGRTQRDGDYSMGLVPLQTPSTGGSDSTYVDAGSQFTGVLKLAKSVRIDGAIDGELECAATVHIGPAGRVKASIVAESVVIDGEVRGDIEARSEITLRKTARVWGDLKTEGIVIERGAKVEGQITIGPSSSSSSATAAVAHSSNGATAQGA